jgi:hypothetical protein
MTTVIADLDTLALSDWRADLRPANGDGDWDTYHQALATDPPDLRLVLLLQGLARCAVEIVLVTDRPSPWMWLTLQWVTMHDVPGIALHMRPENDWSPGPEVKFQFISAQPPPPAFVLSADPRFLELCREQGIMTLEVTR